MPPKKKRTAAIIVQKVPVLPGKISTTRSGRVIKAKNVNLFPILSPKSTANTTTDKVKTPPKKRGRKPRAKIVKIIESSTRKGDTSANTIHQIEGSEEIRSLPVDETTKIVLDETLEENLGDSEQFEVVQIIEEMETGDSKDSGAVEITDGLENLNVSESEIVNEHLEECEDVTPAEIDPLLETIQEVKEVQGEEVLINFENVEFDNEALTVDYITEEFVPVVENSEVIIEESLASLGIKQTEEESIPSTDDTLTEVQGKAEVELPENKDEAEREEDLIAPQFELLEESEVRKALKKDENCEEPKPDSPEEFKTVVPIESLEKPKEIVQEEKIAIPTTIDLTLVESSPKVEKTKLSSKKRQPSRKESKPKMPRRYKSKLKEPKVKTKASKKEMSDLEEVRRSSRIKSISSRNQHSKGKGLVRSKTSKPPGEEATDMTLPPPPPSTEVATPTTSPNNQPQSSSSSEHENRPVKVKSRWRRSSELEMNILTPASIVTETCGDSDRIAEVNSSPIDKSATALPSKSSAIKDEEVQHRLKQFIHLKENLYLTDRMGCKEAKKMTCDCFLTTEETGRGEFGCGEDCLNRLLMIECGCFCPVGDRCTNKKFQKSQFAPVEVFKTDKKGLGLRAAANIPFGEFILEYVGEVLDHEEFDARADDYSNDKNLHYYFMSLRADAIIDATRKGNISRFINHSCDPNAETQKWTVNGELRIGFFSTRMILAGEEITFDYRFQRYGKEAQKCFCEALTCRGWLGEVPDDEDEDEDEEEEDSQEVHDKEGKIDDTTLADVSANENLAVPELKVKTPAVKKERKKRPPRRTARKDIFDDLDVDDEIEMLVTTGLKNQAHTLNLSRLVVRAKEPIQRAKLLRILRRGELPCRRLFLDYHGLRLMHGYMTDAQQLAKTDRKYESFRLELLQTLATLPIPNKTMLQDSKVLPTVEKWAISSVNKELPVDSDSNSPKVEQDAAIPPADVVPPEKSEEDVAEAAVVKAEETPVDKPEEDVVKEEPANNGDSTPIFNEETESSPVLLETSTSTLKSVEKNSDEPNYEEEIIALATKLLEEWSNLKEVFKIPKKERIEQMKEHERAANRGYIAGLGLEQDSEKKSESRYRILKRYRSLDKAEPMSARKNIKLEDRNIVNFPSLGKHERRKMFALQVEQREEERRRKQREMWRQHEQHCFLIGTDPRLTAPFDPNQGYQCIYNPQIGQWQNYPIQSATNMIFNPQTPGGIMAPPVASGYPFVRAGGLPQLPTLPYQDEAKKVEDYSQVKFMGPIPPPVKLPPKWKTAKDKYGRPYYYHIKIRKSQWEPPPFSKPIEEPDDSSDTTSSSDTSSLSSDTSSEDSDSDGDVDDAKLLQDVRKQMEKQPKVSLNINKASAVIAPPPQPTKISEDCSDNSTPQDETQELVEKSEEISEVDKNSDEESLETTVDPRVKDLSKDDNPTPTKKRRTGLVQEIIISPRTEEDRLQFREDLKRYKQNKEKLKREKELLQQGKKQTKEKRHKVTVKAKMKELKEANSESARKIKESFRSNMATVVVGVLNVYRKPDCKEGRITNTEDFKHLARKLTHFVMLKEMKHIEKIEDLVCTENVKVKAKEYIRKYMAKFGENYQKRNDEPDF